MIGAANSPMSQFRGVGSGDGPSMYDIGYNGSPGGAVSNALKMTIDRYHQNLAAQQEQTNKLGLLDHEYALKRAGVVPDPDTNGPQIIKDPVTGKFFYGNSTVDPTTGAVKKNWTPVTNSPPSDEQKIFMNENVYGPMNQAARQSRGEQSSPIPGVPAEAPVVNTGDSQFPMNIPQVGGNTAAPDPSKFKMQRNAKTGETRWVPR